MSSQCLLTARPGAGLSPRPTSGSSPRQIYGCVSLGKIPIGETARLKRFPSTSAGKESACNSGDPGSIPGLGRSPGGGHGNPLQYSCLKNPHGQRSLVGYSPWGH
ncbi:unnamed protein product [Rangifer tarandus platyrhynchus]|uniref:Uncharacterized protein n=1 Tax=Rangifer tarandus platyrhynchus TaxID=3082113 RepID=A0ABN8ZNI0_RANTA|nr:unnamed protein product [Rangifer tarandus platyrhynchus]